MQQGGTWWRRGARGHAAAQAAGLLAPGDGWSAAAAELGLDDPEQINALLQVLEPHLGARPAQHPAWRRQVRALGRREHREACAALRALFEALGEAVPRAATSAAADGRPLLVGRENTVAAVNLVWAAVELLGERAIPTLGLILDRSLTEPWTLDSGRVRNACAGALAGLDTDESASVLISAAASAPTKGQKEQLLLCLDSAEHHGGQPPSRLAELQVPHHGLDRGGLLVLSTHHHEFLLTMLPDGQVTVEDQSSDATPDRAAERIVDAQVRAIRATYRRERTRLEALLATERSWSPGEWRRLYQDHPITRAVASLLVWRHEFADGGVLEMLPDPYGGASYVRQDDEDGVAAYTRQREEMLTPFRADAQPTSVTLWHPRDADPAALAAWRAIRDERGLAQPFEQIDRDFTRVEPDPDSVELNQHAPAAVDAASFEAALTGLDWHSHRSKAGRLSDAIRLVHRDFPDARLSVTVPCREGGETVVLGAGWFYRTQDRARTALALGYVPPRVYSEALRDLAVLARGALPTAGGSFNTEMNDRIEF